MNVLERYKIGNRRSLKSQCYKGTNDNKIRLKREILEILMIV